MLGCTVHLIMMGHAVYPGIVNGKERWYERVADQFGRGQFPRDGHSCSAVTLKCWQKRYGSTHEVVRDLVSVEAEL